MKKAKVAGVQIKSLLELSQFLLPLLMPPSLNEIQQSLNNTALNAATNAMKKVLHIPLVAANYAVDGACFTGRMQISWIGQLVQRLAKKFTLHADTKHKLHHGEWVLTTVGIHVLRWDSHHLTLSTTFVPLVYMLCKQHESLGACKMLLDALVYIAATYFGGVLVPGACMSDHCAAFRRAYEEVFPNVMFGQCWPHIARKWKEGEYCSKTWAHFDEVTAHLQAIHFAHTWEMRDLLMNEFGALWDSWGKQMDKFWSSYCVKGWDNWSVGLFDCMLCTPSQQAQERWHRSILDSKIPGMFRASTEHLFKESLPDLIMMDAAMLPTILNFSVPAVPKKMIQKALWYVDHQQTHVYIHKLDDDHFQYYVLRKDHETGVKQISQRLMEMYVQAAHGQWDKRVKDLDHLVDMCGAFQVVAESCDEWGVCECYLNPAKLDCLYCKGFKGHGICSHVLCVNHMLKKINLRAEVMEIGKSAAKHGGNNQPKHLPALTRAPAREADSSDEEADRLLAMGSQGK